MLLAIVGLWVLLQVTASSNVSLKYSPVISYLRQASDSDVIPIIDNEDGPLEVTVDLSFTNILNVDRDNNMVEVQFWMAVIWRNKALAWNVKDKGFNITIVNIPTNYLWLPDLTVVNAVTKPENLTPGIAVVAYDGTVSWVPGLRSYVTCNLKDLDSQHGANCTIKLLSWTYNAFLLAISPHSSANLNEYSANPSYEILNSSHFKHTNYYPCCPEPYDDFQFSFIIRSTNQNEASTNQNEASTNQNETPSLYRKRSKHL